MDDLNELKDELLRKVMILNDRVWENKISMPAVERWLENFTGKVADPEVERVHALYWLSHFMYFGTREIRVLIRSLYRDLFLSPLIQQIRGAGTAAGESTLQCKISEELASTRFLGVGNPSESGTHLLYYFRQENGLETDLFCDSARLFRRSDSGSRLIANPEVRRYIFLDDLCGSGDQIIAYSDLVADIRDASPQEVEIKYLCIFGTSWGMEKARKASAFGQECYALCELDTSFRCIDELSRYFGPFMPEGIDRNVACSLICVYGNLLNPKYATGWKDSQLLIGMHHNTPDNAPAIIWYDSTWGCELPWSPAFRRYPKV